MAKYEKAGLNTYEVTFTENKKYNPTTRTVTVHAMNEYHATLLTHTSFGSVNVKNFVPVPSKKITVTSVTQIKDEVEETQGDTVEVAV